MGLGWGMGNAYRFFSLSLRSTEIEREEICCLCIYICMYICTGRHHPLWHAHARESVLPTGCLLYLRFQCCTKFVSSFYFLFVPFLCPLLLSSCTRCGVYQSSRLILVRLMILIGCQICGLCLPPHNRHETPIQWQARSGG